MVDGGDQARAFAERGRATMRLFDGLGRDQGPTGRPRVREPVQVDGTASIEVIPPADRPADLPADAA